VNWYTPPPVVGAAGASVAGAGPAVSFAGADAAALSSNPSPSKVINGVPTMATSPSL
jgi:hypothetical protein